jgi:hypothetical protein
MRSIYCALDLAYKETDNGRQLVVQCRRRLQVWNFSAAPRARMLSGYNYHAANIVQSRARLRHWRASGKHAGTWARFTWGAGSLVGTDNCQVNDGVRNRAITVTSGVHARQRTVDCSIEISHVTAFQMETRSQYFTDA